MMIEPASLGLLPPINFAGISPTTKMVIVSSDQDNVACSADSVNIFESTTQVPAAQKNYLFFNSDMTGTPNQVGNHYYPNTYGYKDTAAVDNRDFYVTYKLSVAAAECVINGSSCNVFLGNGSAAQLTMGTWTTVHPSTRCHITRSHELTGDYRLPIGAVQICICMCLRLNFLRSRRRISNS